MTPLRVLVVSAGFLPAESHGGVPYSTFNLSAGLARLPDVEVRVVSTDRNGPSRLRVPTDAWTRYQDLPVVYCSTWPGAYAYAPRMRTFVDESVTWADVVLSSSTLWDYSGAITARLCARAGKPHVVYPRGLLDSWALNHKRWKKQLGLALQGRRILRQAACVVALSDAERESVRALGHGGRVAVIPNGAPEIPDLPDAQARRSAHADLPAGRYLLFLGRISVKKGLAQTLAAFGRVAARHPEAMLVVAGPVDPDYAAEFHRLCAGFDPGRLRVMPPVSGLRKHLLLDGACGFVLTSASEGVPMAVLEAMQYGLPVVVTPQCNVQGVNDREAGWTVPLGDVDSTARALDELLSDEPLRRRRGENARSLAREAYAWTGIARTTHDLLLSITGRTA